MTGCIAFHGSLHMMESIFLNNNEMVSFCWVDVEIRRGRGLALHPVQMMQGYNPEGCGRRGKLAESLSVVGYLTNQSPIPEIQPVLKRRWQ
jgi:hypothetical protein